MAKFLHGRSLKNVIVYGFYVPKIITSIRNWKQYLGSYGSSFSGLIHFRNGLRVRIHDALDTSSMSVIFFKHEYGTVKNDSVILDIGANRGYFSIYAVNSAKNVKVYAFEPIKETYQSVVENIELNGFENKIIPFNKGVAGSDGIRTFSISSSISNSMVLGTNSSNTLEVDCISMKSIMDDNKISHIDLIKIDCEGAEYEIFYNTPTDYLQRISEIRMEYHHINDDTLNISHLTSFLEGQNFKVTKHEPSDERVGITWFKRM